MAVTPADVRRLRLQNGWALQDLAQVSGVNKAYLSEFENGKRRLNDDALAAIEAAFERFKLGGHARPILVVENGHNRLVFVDESGNEVLRPSIAHVRWTEEDGSTYSMFVGDRSDG